MYRLIVVSDIHHYTERFERLIPLINTADYFVFCGDGLNDVMRLRGEIVVPTVCVRGNNDFDTHICDSADIVVGGARAFVTHGHRYGVKSGTDGLLAAALSNNCSLAFFGHTHFTCDKTECGVHMINPGALCEGYYAEVTGDGKTFKCKHCFWDDGQ